MSNKENISSSSISNNSESEVTLLIRFNGYALYGFQYFNEGRGKVLLLTDESADKLPVSKVDNVTFVNFKQCKDLSVIELAPDDLMPGDSYGIMVTIFTEGTFFSIHTVVHDGRPGLTYHYVLTEEGEWDMCKIEGHTFTVDDVISPVNTASVSVPKGTSFTVFTNKSPK